MHPFFRNFPISLLIILILTITGCSLDFCSDKEIGKLITENSGERLFLDFWAGISQKDFERVTRLENKKGELSNGNFEFLYSSMKKIPFQVEWVRNGGIELHYEDTYSKNWDYKFVNLQTTLSGSGKADFYKSIIRVLTDTYNKNSQVLSIDSEVIQSDAYGGAVTYDYLWRSGMPNKEFKIIKLEGFVGYAVAKRESSYAARHHKKEKLADCWIYITYKSKKGYLHEKNLEEKRKRENEDQNKIYRRKQEQKIKENRNKL